MPDRHGVTRNVLVSSQKPDELVRRLALELPAGEGRGKEGLLQTIRDVLENSVNTWDQGFMIKHRGYLGGHGADVGLTTLHAIPERHGFLRRLFAFHNHAPDFFRKLRF